MNTNRKSTAPHNADRKDCEKCKELVKDLAEINYERTYNWICPDCGKEYPVGYKVKKEGNFNK
ncbi:MAG: hypothetical protein LBU04_06630 [Christensenellaceae bacterium]|jgi:predicted RNA-binding Zn-ribbon protein involved in translation (DUF1610 family)|nr:hypothetical protein [Christensenellaceae bacterium]